MNEVLYADDLILMSKSTERMRERFLKWNEAFENQKLKVNCSKTKVIVNGFKVDPCVKCGKKVMKNKVLHTKCGK